METLPGLLTRPRCLELDRAEIYPDDRVKFEAIIWKHSQTTETIGRSLAIPEFITIIL